MKLPSVALLLLSAVATLADAAVHPVTNEIRFENRSGGGRGRPNLGREGRGKRGMMPDDATFAQFRQRQGIKAGFDLMNSLVYVDDEENTIEFADGTIIQLNDDDLLNESIYKPGAKCYSDGVQVDCPTTSSVWVKRINGMRLQVNTNGETGDIESISLRRGGVIQILEAVEAGIFVSVPEDAFDEEFYGQFHMQSAVVGGSNPGRRNLRTRIQSSIEKQDFSSHEQNRRRLECDSYRVVEVAVAVESSFCTTTGGEANAYSTVESIMADVSADYEMDGLCFKAVIAHYESHCEEASDPYKDGVDLNQSGCGATGLLQFVQDYWVAERNDVERDLVQLFSGTGT